MIHLGDITKIHEPPRAEVVIGGSPCQDLSVAGKRAGLAGERSGLFMEQIRLIKEMRENDIRAGRTDTDVYPRFMVWENVPGALSSNRGEDFRAVLEETVRVADKTAAIPRYEGGSWRTSGVIMGDGFSVAWRVHDAQFWGVPQRRRRISLVADFGGNAAPEILFESESLSGDSAESGEAREGTAGDSAGSAYPSVAGTLKMRMDGSPCPDRGNGAQIVVQSVLNPWDTQSARIFSQGGVFHTLNSREKSGLDRSGVLAFKLGNGDKARGIGLEVELAPTLNAECGGNKPAVCYDEVQITSPINRSNPKVNDPAPTLNCDNVAMTEVCNTLDTMHDQQAVISSSVVRRLTPLECERLQGYPDGWTDIGDWTDSRGKLRKTSDSARYKALGNSIALPFWDWMLRRLNGYCVAHTMASLFDGIGGFPLIWERINGRGSCLWASEIEEFPIAVTKYHFGR